MEVLLKAKKFKVVKKGHLEVVVHPGAVVILPFLDDETILLIKNQRYSIGETLVELPAGTLDKNEEPLLCAARELEEETGYHAKTFTRLLKFYSSPGFCDELLYVFVAKDLKYVGQKLDDHEKIEVFPVTFEKALTMIQEGIICDAKTIASLLHYKTFFKN